MKLTIKNIGKLKEAEVEINGITVIAGENNSGKSTVGRVLFYIFNSFYKMNEKIIDFKRINVRQRLLMIPTIYDDNFNRSSEIQKLVNEFLREKNHTEESIKNKIIDYIRKKENLVSFEADIDNIEESSKYIYRTLNLKDRNIEDFILEKNIQNEFFNQVNNIYSNEYGEIILDIKSKNLILKIENNEIVEIHKDLNITTEVFYIDNPSLLDLLNENQEKSFNQRTYILKNHKDYLVNKLLKSRESIDDANELLVKEKSKEFIQKLDKIFNGTIIQNKDKKFVYVKKDGKEELDVRNISLGLKSLGIFKMLTSNSLIEENGTIVLDEPEIHLHPEWQVKLAELIVLLQKEFGMHILLTTHSPYFLKAIQVYSKKYDISEKCNYYMTKIEGKEAILVDKTNNLEDIFYKLAIPFENLMNEEKIYE